MKVFGKSKDGYTVHISKDEMDFIIYGYASPSYRKEKIPNYDAIQKQLESAMCEVEICDRYKRVVQIASDSEFKNTEEYSAVIKKLKAAIENLKPYTKLITNIEDQIE